MTQREPVSQKSAADAEKQQQEFSTWLTERNIGFVLIGALLFYAVERLLTTFNKAFFTPTYNKCKQWLGFPSQEQLSNFEQVVWALFEFAVAVFLIYLISRYITKDRPSPT